jgi:superfamily II DNA helicase RecQ
MKGFLYQRELGWFVKATNDMAEVIYLLHPKDAEIMESAFTDKFNRLVDFEIVKEYTDEHTNQVQSYAKLVKPQADKTERKVKLKAYQEMAENSWEGCDGCTEDDKYFHIKGYMAAMLGKEINNSESWGKETGY